LALIQLLTSDFQSRDSELGYYVAVQKFTHTSHFSGAESGRATPEFAAFDPSAGWIDAVRV
jgi:hypothetical protein